MAGPSPERVDNSIIEENTCTAYLYQYKRKRVAKTLRGTEGDIVKEHFQGQL